MIRGIDVSVYNSDEPKAPIDWQEVANSGVTFAFLRASVGYEVDAAFPYNYDEAGKAGVLRGAYHYFHPDKSLGEQAKIHLAVVGDRPTELPSVLDLEKKVDLSAKTISERSYGWLMAVADETGKRPLIYTSPGYWNGVFKEDPPEWTGLFDLWVADWGQNNNPDDFFDPRLPRGFTKWLFHQHTSKGRTPGIVGDVDLNKWHSTLEDLKIYAGINSEPEEPPTVHVNLSTTAPEGVKVVYVIEDD